MTGFGRSAFKTRTGAVQIEIKTTNHRYFEFASRLPYALMPHEEQIRKITQDTVKRGKVYLTITAAELLVRRGQLYVDEALAKEYYKAFQRLNKTLKLKEKVTLRQVAKMPEVITSTTSIAEQEKVWKGMRQALLKALKSLDQSRRTEGSALQRELLSRGGNARKALVQIKKRAPKILSRYKTRAMARFKKEPKTQQGLERLNQDISSFAKTTDITEEMVRLKSHLVNFQKTLKQGGEIGRKVDFIAQEMMREINTTGAKCNDMVISEKVIEIKSELEKIREQAQNLE